jgi:ATP-dependent helicase Lhr and Lhr-like helicase
VIHIGSAKGVARLVQRAGRSGHQPGGTSVLHFVPTHAFELIELAAAMRILNQDRSFEARRPLAAPLDCLCQHAVTVGCAQPFTREKLAAEVRDCRSYRELSDEDLNWVLSYIHFGGSALKAYADFHRVELHNGQYQVTHPMVARRHRMAIGTITSDLSVEVKFLNGQRVGTVEEGFVGRLKPADRFQFAGRTLELVQLREGIAFVKKSNQAATVTPRWLGGRLPLSANLASEVRKILGDSNQKTQLSGDLKLLTDLIDIQQRWSAVPQLDELLVESFHHRGRYQVCCYTLDGRLVHEGLSALVAYRLSQTRPRTIMLAVNDFGWMLDSDEPLVETPQELIELLTPQALDLQIEHVVNGTEMAKRQFREIAQIAGLIHPGYPGQPKRARYLQASANMFYEAFVNYDPNNFLLRQAKHEVLERQLEWTRLKELLGRLQNQKIVWTRPKAYTPFAFPLVVEQLRDRVSSESLAARIQKMVQQLDRIADEGK